MPFSPTSDQSSPTRQSLIKADLRVWFASPPRVHGERDPHRVVSFLELFYDLVFVVLVGQIAHALVSHVTWSGIAEFSVTYGLIWIAWLNGSMYHDLHGREDGRSRSFIFSQMLVLVVLAVYAGHAAVPDDPDGEAFSVVYAILVLLLARQWWRLRKIDQDETARRSVGRWVIGLLAVGALVLIGGFSPGEVRVWLWGLAVVIWVGGWVVQVLLWPSSVSAAEPTESSAERSGLFTILVLGEVVVGVVDGLMASDRTPLVMVTGLLALAIGFGFWWSYFDFAGRRLPRPGRAYAVWVIVQLPLTGSIAAAGAGMVSLIEHGEEAHTPVAIAWLLSVASATTLLWLAIMVAVLQYEPLLAPHRANMIRWCAFGAVASVLVGWWAPAPWLLALALVGIHSIVWASVLFVGIWNRATVALEAARRGA